MTSSVAASYIELDAEGRAWITGANTKVIEVVCDKLAHSSSPEDIHSQHPHLTLAQIHSALAYYYDHKAEFDAEIAQQCEEFDELRASVENSPLRQKLRAMDKLK
ncbi:MAG: DUF433 domain-containing protein [Acidobacteriota bacterium]